jgi:hypothetical protein
MSVSMISGLDGFSVAGGGSSRKAISGGGVLVAFGGIQ